jgi:propionyl-CoA synthetase
VRGLSVRDYEAFYRWSVEEPEDFWAEQARKIHWNRDWDEVLDYGSPPFARWFVGGETNLCYNAVDRYLQDCADQDALVYISTETGERATYTFRELHAEVNAFAAVLRDLGVVRAIGS